MADNQKKHKRKRVDSVQEALAQVRSIVERHKLVEGLVHMQDVPRHELVEGLVHKQNIAELKNKLDTLHPADIAAILEQLPLDERLEAGLAVAAYSSAQGAHLIRTHDVRATRRAVRMIDAIRNSGTTTGAEASQPVEAAE